MLKLIAAVLGMACLYGVIGRTSGADAAVVVSAAASYVSLVAWGILRQA